jgi:hypothetical protein
VHAHSFAHSFDTNTSLDMAGATIDNKVISLPVGSTDDLSEEITKQSSTSNLAEIVKVLPYVLPHELLQAIANRDALTFLGSANGSPTNFQSDLENCQLCGSKLGDLCIHPGQSRANTCYLLTELNPFKEVDIMVKICYTSAMHQASAEKLGTG